jgi:hypothetical protein
MGFTILPALPSFLSFGLYGMEIRLLLNNSRPLADLVYPGVRICFGLP